MGIDSAELKETFEAFWSDLQRIFQPGKIIGKYYGKSITFKALELSSITIESQDSGGLVKIDKASFKDIYNNWQTYRYEKLSSSNTQLILDIISITDYVIQTWVRRKERHEIINRAKEAGMHDGVFWLLNYNFHTRMIGPSPNGEIIPVLEVFSEEDPKKIKEIESAALSLLESANMICEKYDDESFSPREWLKSYFPQFSENAHSSVIYRANYMAIK